MKVILHKLQCPVCERKSCVLVDVNNGLLTEDYLDIPVMCTHCQTELRLVYDFSDLTVD